MLKPTETVKNQSFWEKMQKSSFFRKNCKNISFSITFSQNIKIGYKLPYWELRKRLNKVVKIKEKGRSGFKSTETSKKLKVFGNKTAKIFSF